MSLYVWTSCQVCVQHYLKQRHAIAYGRDEVDRLRSEYKSLCRTVTARKERSCVHPSIRGAGGPSEASTLCAVLSPEMPPAEGTSSQARLLSVVQRS